MIKRKTADALAEIGLEADASATGDVMPFGMLKQFSSEDVSAV